ncbi:MFS transporter [Argonema antarcticum]|uniref:MFS transporter n=1 Tax=Argonema antarcticum TaxID=2942763 RepID=UPI0020127448|nr:MFS transporter [Argonema antarcticum]MCL1471396.1 MFS transporter [Argonema antarcticum A004/B2]
MINPKSFKKFGLLGSLYVSQFIPIACLYEALPVIMRQRGASLEAIGFLPLLTLPWMLKFLWSPLVDRYGFTRWGHYRFWIICFQLIAACTVATFAFIDIQSQLSVAYICLVIICFVCASQDIATDALAVGLLEPQERGFGNGVQSAGNYLGAIIGGGGMLLAIDRWGWKASMLTLALVVVVALLPVLQYKEPSSKPQKSARAKSNSQKPANPFTDIAKFFGRPGIWHWLLILSLYTPGPYMASRMFRPLLVDLGLSLAEIGLMLGVVSYSVGILGSIVGGSLIAPLGRKRSLILFGLLQALTMLTYLLPAFGIAHLAILYAIAIGTQFVSSMAATVLYTIMMDKSRLEAAGTDYTLQSSTTFFFGIITAAIGGVIAQALGYRGVFVVAITITLIGITLVAKTFNPDRPASLPMRDRVSS